MKETLKGIAVSLLILATFAAGYNAGHDDGVKDGIRKGNAHKSVTGRFVDDTPATVADNVLTNCAVVLLATGDFRTEWCNGIAEDDARLMPVYDELDAQATPATSAPVQVYTSSTVVTREGGE